MYNYLKNIKLNENLIIVAEFNDGTVNQYDLNNCIKKYPVFSSLINNEELYRNGYIAPGGSGIIWNDNVDIAAEEIYDNGIFIERKEIESINVIIANNVTKARNMKGISQEELSKRTGIYQAEISKIERGIGNPSIKTLERIAKGLGLTLKLFFE